MARVTAQFSNGRTKEIKNSRRNYSHAWRWWAVREDGETAGNTGFCSSYVIGMKSAASDFNFHNKWSQKDKRGELKNFEFEVVVTVVGDA